MFELRTRNVNKMNYSPPIGIDYTVQYTITCGFIPTTTEKRQPPLFSRNKLQPSRFHFNWELNSLSAEDAINQLLKSPTGDSSARHSDSQSVCFRNRQTEVDTARGGQTRAEFREKPVYFKENRSTSGVSLRVIVKPVARSGAVIMKLSPPPTVLRP